jgi:ABC-type amino acid transport substrate-binding protein
MKEKRSIILFTLLLIIFSICPSMAKDNSHAIIESASELDYPPFSIVQSDGSADGFSVDLLKAVSRVYACYSR